MDTMAEPTTAIAWINHHIDNPTGWYRSPLKPSEAVLSTDGPDDSIVSGCGNPDRWVCFSIVAEWCIKKLPNQSLAVLVRGPVSVCTVDKVEDSGQILHCCTTYQAAFSIGQLIQFMSPLRFQK